MDVIFSQRPVDQLENADSKIKTYVLLLEKKLKTCIAMSSLNKEIEMKYLDVQEELYSIKLQNKENGQSDDLLKKEVEKLSMKNENLDTENKQLKQMLLKLQNEIQQLKRTDKSFKTANISNNKEVPVEQLNHVGDNDPDANSVLVKGFTEKQLSVVPKKNIIELGRYMNIKVMDHDILNVSKMERKYYERHNLKPENIILIVRFRTAELKVEYLKHKEKLKTFAQWEDIEIIDYVSDEVFNLYQYAKILKAFGYALIYWRNNRVYVKKTRSNLCEPILIQSKSDVDALKVTVKK